MPRRRFLILLVISILFVTQGSPKSFAQQQNKHEKAVPGPAQAAALPIPDPMRIETTISEMLAAWQVGDIARLHQFYDDGAIFVSGNFEPAVVGWQRYAASYEQEEKYLTHARLDRENTVIRVKGNIAWATYQWTFTGLYDEKPISSRGQATLILERRGMNWVILHNHTSEICEGQPNPPAGRTATR